MGGVSPASMRRFRSSNAAPKVPGPRGRVHPPVKRGPAVRVAVEHVELVRHLVDDDVVAVAAPRGLHVLEGEDDRSAEPRLPASLLLPSMLDARVVHLVPARNEARGIDHHRPPGPVGVEPEGEDRQARLGRDDRDVHRAERLSEHRLDGLSGHEARREVAKAGPLILFEGVEDREAVEHRRPVGVVDPSRAAMRPHRGLQPSCVSGGHDTRPSPGVSTTQGNATRGRLRPERANLAFADPGSGREDHPPRAVGPNRAARRITWP